MEADASRETMMVASTAFAVGLALIAIFSWGQYGPWSGARLSLMMSIAATAGTIMIWRLREWWRAPAAAMSLLASFGVGASIPATVIGLLSVGPEPPTSPSEVGSLVSIGMAATLYLAVAGASLLAGEGRRTC